MSIVPNYDKQFAEMCAWLKENKLTAHVNIKGKMVLRYKMERKPNAGNP